jgi:hypothetical protein
VNGIDKELFYVIEKKNEGLTIIPRHNVLYRERNDPTSPVPSPYVESRISIHVTPNNPSGNTIHRTVISKDAAVDSYIWTDAVKRKTGFTPIFSKLCSNMRVGFDPKRHDMIVRVRSYNPSVLVLCYSVWVSAPEREFRLYRRQFPSNNGTVFYSFAQPFDFHTVDAVFKRFRLTLLVSYILGPSEDEEVSIHTNTLREGDSRITPENAKINRHFVSGRDENICAIVYEIQREALREMHIDAHGLPEFKDFALRIARFFAYPPNEICS